VTHDNRISELYQQSSQETPPARLDRAVMDMAGKSVRRRAFSPFGNHWVTGGVMVGVVMLSALLILTVPPQERYLLAPEQDTATASKDALSKQPREAAERRELFLEIPAEPEEKRQAPAVPGAQFDFYEALPDAEVNIPEDEGMGLRELKQSVKQRQAPAAEKPAGATVAAPQVIHYLQAGSFREKDRAIGLKEKLLGLGFKCEIQTVSINNKDVYHRVRVGPFTDLEALDKSRKKLGELGIGAQTVEYRE
jgi:cell division protein FtsN